MKTLKIGIKLKMKGDKDDLETLKEDVYQHLQELMEEDDLEFTIDDDEEEDEDM